MCFVVVDVGDVMVVSVVDDDVVVVGRKYVAFVLKIDVFCDVKSVCGFVCYSSSCFCCCGF